MATEKQTNSEDMKISKDRHSLDGQRLKTILKLGCANDNNLLNDIILYIYLGPDFNSKYSDIYDSYNGQIDQKLLRAEASKSNWRQRVDPALMNASEEDIIKNFKESVSLYNSACESFKSEMEIEDLIYKMLIASCFVREKLENDRSRLFKVLNREKFYFRCFPQSKNHLIESEIKLIQNLKTSSFEDWEFGSWKLDVPIIKHKKQKLEDFTPKKSKVLEKYECSLINDGRNLCDNSKNFIDENIIEIEQTKLQSNDLQSKASSNLTWCVLLLIFFIIVRTMISINNPNTRCKFIILISIVSLVLYTLSFYY